ncbi:MAG TPA: hypothetical protein VIK03_11765 [Thermoleophilia bacterium]
MPLGNADIEPPFGAGEIGPLLEVFKGAMGSTMLRGYVCRVYGAG